MIVYNHKNNKKINQLILNTDCCYYKNIFENQKLPTFFLNLPLPQDCQSLLGLYVHFEIPKLEVYQHNDLFKKHTVFLTKQLKHYFHFENTHLIHLDMNNFFIVMFNINNHDMIYHTKYFIKNSQKKIIKYNAQHYHLQVKCGLYYTDKVINANEFFHLTKEQYHNTLKHQTSFSFDAL